MYKTKEELLNKSKEALGKKFSEIEKYHRLNDKLNKGALGQLVEESHFEYKVNSRKGPDFPEAGVELKVTPYKPYKRKSGFRAKERLVLGIIDYNEMSKYEFYNSPFWEKNKVLLIMLYLHDEKLEVEEMKLGYSFLFEYPEEDMKIIIEDYNIIREKINDGKAHELSESDTRILAACTKGGTFRTQPYNNIKAKQRALSFKPSYMTHIFNKYIMGDGYSDRIINSVNFNLYGNLEEYIQRTVSSYSENSVKDLKERYNIVSDSLQVNAMIISRMFNVKNLSDSVEFIKGGYMFKTIRVNNSNSINESMSFPVFDFREIIEGEFEESQFYDIFKNTTFVFAIFKKNKKNVEKFHSVKFWKMPDNIIFKDIKELWIETIKIIKSGYIYDKSVYDKNGKEKRLNHFLGQGQTNVAHIRNHAKNGKDVARLPVKEKNLNTDSYSKMCIWLNSAFIKTLILDMIQENIKIQLELSADFKNNIEY